MPRLTLYLLCSFLFITSCSHSEKNRENEVTASSAQTKTLMKVAEFHGAQVTGVTMAEDGRLFASFPRWRKDIPFSVVEVNRDGTTNPFPDREWNSWQGKPKPLHFVCVQSVVAHKKSLFVLDPASPMMKGVLGNAMLYEFDLATNALKRSWKFEKNVAPTNSYLNDLRIDDEAQKIYMTDSGMGAIVVLDLKSGKAKRYLDKDPSVRAEKITLNVLGKPFLIKGKPAQVHSDGIEYDPKEKMLYYHALTGKTLYRVPVDALDAKNIENLGRTPAPDGMIFDKKGNLYMADLENNSIVYRTPSGEIKVLVQDPRIGWADTFTLDKENNLLFTDSKLGEAAPGQAVDGMTFGIYKVALPE